MHTSHLSRCFLSSFFFFFSSFFFCFAVLGLVEASTLSVLTEDELDAGVAVGGGDVGGVCVITAADGVGERRGSG